MLQVERITQSSEAPYFFIQLQYILYKKYLIERQYGECLTNARAWANSLELLGHHPDDIVEFTMEYLEEKSPELRILVDPEYQDIYVEIISAETRVYFNWMARL